ncbi:MAG: hypothetical protein PVH30_03490, partial [Desulfobacterales bacterium]
MSLILESLQRAEEERRGARISTSAPQPRAPDPSKRRRWAFRSGLAVVALLLIALLAVVITWEEGDDGVSTARRPDPPAPSPIRQRSEPQQRAPAAPPVTPEPPDLTEEAAPVRVPGPSRQPAAETESFPADEHPAIEMPSVDETERTDPAFAEAAPSVTDTQVTISPQPVVNPAAGTRSPASSDSVPLLRELPASLQTRYGHLNLNVVVYENDQDRSLVFINM